jgi:uncharacterized protein (TIGR03435 family)
MTATENGREKFQAEIKRSLGFVAHHENCETDALVLKLKSPGAPGLADGDGGRPKVTHQDGAFLFSNEPVSELARYLTGGLNRLVIDQTGLTNRYDYSVPWPERDGHLDQDALDLRSLGLELIPGKVPAEMLVVEKTP